VLAALIALGRLWQGWYAGAGIGAFAAGIGAFAAGTGAFAAWLGRRTSAPDDDPLGWRRLAIAAACGVVLAITFAPVPVR
jgi:hypothetical protein